MVVPLHIVGAGYEFYAEFLFQIEEFFLLVTHNEIYLVHAGSLKLADLTFNEHLPTHVEHAFGTIVGNGRKPAGEAGREDYGILYPVGLESRNTFVGNSPIGNEAFFFKLLAPSVHGTNRHADCRRQSPLA